MTEGAVHQGFVLRVAAFAYTDLAAILKQTAQEENRFCWFSMIRDPHNLGSILRTADATNVSGVIIPKHRAVGVTPVVSKTSTGQWNTFPLRVWPISAKPRQAKGRGLLDLWNRHERHAISSVEYGWQVGLDHWQWRKRDLSQYQKTSRWDDHHSMNGHVQSLNASVAAAIHVWGLSQPTIILERQWYETKILLVDGYNMIAFWQETRQLFQKSELDAAQYPPAKTEPLC